MYRLPTELETLEAFELIEAAITDRRVVDVSYLKALKDARGNPRQFTDELPRVAATFGPRPMLTAAPVRRVVEPVLIAWSREGNPYMHVISYSSPNEERPAARTIRLDRVVRLRVTPRPFTVAGTALDPTLERV